MLRTQWQSYFESVDLLITPVATSPAFLHNQQGERWERLLKVNGQDQPHTDSLFWAGYSGVVGLPATAIGFNKPDGDIMRRRREWFEHIEVYQCLWWIPTGHRPSVEEGLARLNLFEQLGATAEAFSFKNPYPAPDGQPAFPVLDECA